MAVQHHQAGRLQEAERCYRQILHVDPHHPQALHLLGFLAHEVGKHELAVEYINKAIQQDGRQPAFHHNLGEAQRALGKMPEAIACHERALELQPDLLESRYNLGLALQQCGRLDEAVACFRRVLQQQPDDTDAHNALGNALKDQGQIAEAIACYQEALHLRPDFANAVTNLGNTWREQGLLADALACYQRAVSLQPSNAEYHNNLGNAFKNQGRLADALACYQRALELDPNYATAHYNMGLVYQEQRHLDKAIPCYEKAIKIRQDFLAPLGLLVHGRQHLCLWHDIEELSQRVLQAVVNPTGGRAKDRLAPFPFLTLPIATAAEQQLRCTEQFVQERFAAAMRLGSQRAWPPLDKSTRRVRIGYLSADFQTHATAHLISELFEKHDRARFEVLGYSYGPDDGSLSRRRIARACDHFVDLQDASIHEAVQRIHADGVHILVDLKGHTGQARTEILAQRPAPVQVNYLGYPGTMGAPFIDYILVDDFVAPTHQQPFFTEKLVHLPGCYQVNDSRRAIAPRTPDRAECGLPKEGFVFCSFNNNYKITPPMFQVWMRLLRAVPGSVLWLLESNRFVPVNLRREAESQGVVADRLVFAPHQPLPEHLARHRLADLFLDTYPVNAHTSASDALWAGCPLLTLAGATFISRVAGSLLRALGLSELITTCLDDYHDLALRLAREPALLADLRKRLEANRETSALFDSGQFAQNLESAYGTMWEIYTSGEKPRSFATRPLATI